MQSSSTEFSEENRNDEGRGKREGQVGHGNLLEFPRHATVTNGGGSQGRRDEVGRRHPQTLPQAIPRVTLPVSAVNPEPPAGIVYGRRVGPKPSGYLQTIARIP